jgi:hypothetical protein
MGDGRGFVSGPSIYGASNSSLYTGDFPFERPIGVRAIMLDTLYSLFVGRSPGVASPAEVMASAYGYNAGY